MSGKQQTRLKIYQFWETVIPALWHTPAEIYKLRINSVFERNFDF